MDESVIKHLEQAQRVTKLSQAIRIGALMRPQCTGVPHRDGTSCAWGAAADGLGLRIRADTTGATVMAVGKSLYGDAWWAWGIRTDNGESLADRVWQMNDGGQTREEIADWLEARGL